MNLVQYILMLGPVIGAALYGLGGFQLPFVVVGSVGIALAICLFIVTPNDIDSGNKKDGKDEQCRRPPPDATPPHATRRLCHRIRCAAPSQRLSSAPRRAAPASRATRRRPRTRRASRRAAPAARRRGAASTAGCRAAPARTRPRAGRSPAAGTLESVQSLGGRIR